MTAATPASETFPRSPETSGPETSSQRLARLHVNTGAIADNWRTFARIASGAMCAAVVKADGYGLGAKDAASALAQAGARIFFTATTDEALGVRRALGEGPQIIVLNGPSSDDVSHFTAARLTPVLNSLAQIALWNGRGAAALHIDTGMNRLGIGPDELSRASDALKDATLALVMSHLACASTLSHEMNARQRARLVEMAKLFPSAPLSLSSTAGALIGSDFHFDLIRPGLGLYGSAGLDDGFKGPKLSAAATVEAPILQVRDVEPGEAFGYGASVTAPKKMRAATVAIGYADGLLRSLSGRGYGVLGGAKRPILGRVSMDLTILDVTNCPEAKPGAMVEFLGANAHVDEMATLAGTAPYELLTTFVGTVRRSGRRA